MIREIIEDACQLLMVFVIVISLSIIAFGFAPIVP